MMERSPRRARPSLEGLEGRTLLNGSKNHAVHAQATGTGTATVTLATANRFDYIAADGGRVDVRLTGPGNLTGTTLDGSGNLNIVFAQTSVFTKIIGRVRGGSGQADLGTIRNANLALTSLTGVGGELIGKIDLTPFNLVSGGNINLTAGVNELYLNSVAANSQMHLRDTPLNTTLGISTSVDPLTGAGLGYAGNQPYKSNGSGIATTAVSNTAFSTNATGGTTTTISGISGVMNPGTLDPTITGFGGTNVGIINGAVPIIASIGNGQNVRGTPGLTQAQVSFGRTLAYAFETTNVNAIRLNSVAGTFTPGANLIEPRDVSRAGYNHVPPPGVILNIKHVNGVSPTGNAPLGDPNIYGVDPATNRLVRFDAATGAVLGAINLPGAALTNGVGGVGLARNNAELVVLAGVGQTVSAYDALSGVFVGSFATPRPVGGIATSNGQTVLVDVATAPDGVAQTVNVAASLLTGQEIPVGAPLAPAREFILGGGVTGVPGTGNIYALGSGFFDTAQPNRMQAGLLALSASTTGTLAEVSRTALSLAGGYVPAANGVITNDPARALGSIESSLALDTAVVNGTNVLTLLNPSTLATQGSVALQYPTALSDLSESFHPEVAGTALIDVQGNVQYFTASTANGLVLNDAGNLNRVTVGTATNSSIIGLPFGHVDIQNRQNVTITTNSRLVGDRGDVIVNPAQRPVGPLSLP